MRPKTDPQGGPTRRNVLAVATGSVALPLALPQAQAATRPAGDRSAVDITLKINGRDRRLSVDEVRDRMLLMTSALLAMPARSWACS